jgi:hypothetical protein
VAKIQRIFDGVVKKLTTMKGFNKLSLTTQNLATQFVIP